MSTTKIDLKRSLKKKDLEVLTFTKVTVWVHKKNTFTLITKLLKLVCAIPSSTEKCEKKISGLYFIKNKLCNKLGDDFQDDLILSFLEKT